MDRNVNFRLDSGTYMVIEANAKKQGQTVSDWIRAAIQEQVKRTVNVRMLDRIDERVYALTKDTSAIKAMLTKLQEAVDEIVPLEE
jgi:predicted DNA-binding protein